jgi:hypothetical protein
MLVEAFRGTERIDVAVTHVARKLKSIGRAYDAAVHQDVVSTLEAMVRDGWLLPSHVPGANPISVDLMSAEWIDDNHDLDLPGVAPSLLAV